MTTIENDTEAAQIRKVLRAILTVNIVEDGQRCHTAENNERRRLAREAIERHCDEPPAPPAKVLRPWTWDELWARRDCWFREMSYQEMPMRITEFNSNAPVCHIGEDLTAVQLRDKWQFYDHETGRWLPCGEWADERPVTP